MYNRDSGKVDLSERTPMTVGPGLGTAVKEELAMAKFTVNGRAVTVENNQKLLRYLRDTLHLTSVKDGCSEGACGTCTVLIDGACACS